MWIVDGMGGLHGLEFVQAALMNSCFIGKEISARLYHNRKGNKQSSSQWVTVTVLCCALTPSITSDRPMTCCHSEGKEPPVCVCVCVCVWVWPSLFPGLTGSSLGGCDTNSYKASIMERKVDTAWQLAAQDTGVLPHLVNNSFRELCCRGESSKDGWWLKNFSSEEKRSWLIWLL